MNPAIEMPQVSSSRWRVSYRPATEKALATDRCWIRHVPRLQICREILCSKHHRTGCGQGGELIPCQDVHEYTFPLSYTLVDKVYNYKKPRYLALVCRVDIVQLIALTRATWPFFSLSPLSEASPREP
jgi:hypothetical protein